MIALLAFLVLLGAIVTIHEFGHFIVAKLSNVKVHIFSIGFGQPIISKKIGETEYRIAWIPLGGYVRLHGMEKEFGDLSKDEFSEEALAELQEEQHDEDQGRSLSDKSPLTKILIFFAGPLMNFVLPFLVLIPFFYYSKLFDQEISSHIGALDEGLPGYQAGIRDGDEVIEINGQQIYAFWQISQFVKGSVLDGPPLHIKLKRNDQILEFDVRPKLIQETDKFISSKVSYPVIGFQPYALASDIMVTSQSIFDKYGLKPFDRITRINTQEIKRFYEVESAIQSLKADEEIQITVERLSVLDEHVDFLQSAHFLEITLPPKNTWGLAQDQVLKLDALGLSSAANCISSIHPQLPASKVFQVGDCITSVDGQPNKLASFIASRIQHEPQKSKMITLLRDGVSILVELKLESQIHKNALAGELTYWPLGFQLYSLSRPDARMDAIMVSNQERFAYAWYKTKDFVFTELSKSVMTLGGMFKGNVSPTQLGGPVTIFYLAGENAKAGFDRFIMLLVVLSIGVGVLNLVPIPGLDGGHILFATIELLIRKPLPPKIKANIQMIGVMALFALILFALGNDILRMFRIFSGE